MNCLLLFGHESRHLVGSDNTATVMDVTHTCDHMPNRKSEGHGGAL